MDVSIQRGEEKSGQVTIPASKSLSHRALIAAALHDGVSYISNLVMNKDTEATMRVLKSLGATFTFQGDEVEVCGIHDFSKFTGEILDCGESGSTLRFLIPIFALMDQEVIFTGQGRLMERPLTVYEKLFHEQGLLFRQEGKYLHIKGPLRSGHFEIAGNISSQFITGLMYALPLTNDDSTIQIIQPYESRSYVLMSEDILQRAGIKIEDAGETILVKGKQTFQALNMRVDGDDSQAAFFACLSAIKQVPITIHGMNTKSAQGDHVIFSILQSMGMEIVELEDGYELLPHTLKPITVDLGDCPDLGPVLFALATTIAGETVFINAERLRIKESDRIACMEEELQKLGCDIHSTKDTVYVKGPTTLKQNVILQGHNDHRIVMALSVLLTACQSQGIVQGAQAITKSYPTFFEDLSNCHVEVKYYD